MSDRELMEKILKEVSGVKEEISGVKGEISELKSDIKLIKTQQSEQGEILQAVRHAQEAQSDKFEIDLAKLSGKMDQGFSDVVEVQKALLDMYGEHEAAIRIMRRRSV
jgi:predicted  nucleic acid-binding Zn-ribbon protein